MDTITPGWQFIGIGTQGFGISLRGVDPWKHQWTRCGTEKIVVSHPSYPAERHTMFVFSLESEGRSLRFAAGEYSNGVYGFYLPEVGAN
jgi:hypothetical protein